MEELAGKGHGHIVAAQEVGGVAAGKREAETTQLAFDPVLYSHPVADQLPAAADHLAVSQLLRAGNPDGSSSSAWHFWNQKKT